MVKIRNYYKLRSSIISIFLIYYSGDLLSMWMLQCETLSVQKRILGEETVKWYGYDDQCEWTVLIYVLVNKLCL